MYRFLLGAAFVSTMITSKALIGKALIAMAYTEEEVSFVNPRAPHVTLSGTLSIPNGKGPRINNLII